jgi:hypothetical protein
MDTPTMEKMEAVQEHFQSLYADKAGVLGIGIGSNSAQDGMALNVYVTNAKIAKSLPKELDGVEVVYDVVGGFKAAR